MKASNSKLAVKPKQRARDLVGKTVLVRRVGALNDVGGSYDVHGTFKVLVGRAWFDKLWRFEGQLCGEELAAVKAEGVTGYVPEDYAEYEAKNPGIVERTRADAEAFRTSRTVFFNEFEVVL